ncbi:MAG: N-acetyltransferase [Paraglaciecola sp.]|uniref:GNAT family N-acetyltransferase n=1 Tax=Paraglaciecola sp. TaxID=1920173 RepID=UPI0032992F7B
MITKLENSNEDVANQIHRVFQSSYKIEAELIGTPDFPPLKRSAKDIVNSTTDFYGFNEQTCLAAIIEIQIIGKQLDIHSLTVDPTFFRKGIADKLTSYVLKSFDINTATVETAEVNQPAINLYKKHGFIEFKRWTPSHGIPKVAMSINPLSCKV